jgi:hypothetical protein
MLTAGPHRWGKTLAPSGSISYNPVRVFFLAARGPGEWYLREGIQSERQYIAQEADDEANL